MPRDEHDPVLLCERCGYRIEGLPHERPCPECGRPVRSSLPSARPGSPWQKQGGQATGLRTTVAALRRPAALFEQIQIRGSQDDPLLAGAIAATSLLLAMAAWLASLRTIWKSQGSLDTGTVLGAAAFAAVVGGFGSVIVLHALTAIEHWGVRFFAARRGWRVTRNVATSVCAHASAGWLLSGALVLLGALLGMWAEGAAGEAPGWLRTSLRAAPTVLPLAGFFAGLLLFETLVYIGVRRCRFANE